VVGIRGKRIRRKIGYGGIFLGFECAGTGRLERQREAGGRARAQPAPLSMREALRQIWKVASYPIRGNEAWRIAARMDAEALEQAGTAVPVPDDPPEFAGWIASFWDPLPDSEREDILSAIYDVFDPDRERADARTIPANGGICHARGR
jgi:hypothetical protein